MDGWAPWTDGRLRAAWARGDMAAVFTLYRRLSGLSQMELGERVGMPQPHVSTVENGRRTITSAQVLARISEGLEVPEELGGMARKRGLSQWVPDPELRDRIAVAHTRGRADLRVADRIGGVLAAHRRAEDEVGGRDLWPIVRAQLDAVTRMLPGCSGHAADRLLILAAEHAHWLSWVAMQHGRPGPAAAWLDLAHGWAVDAGSADMASWISRVRAHYSLKAGDPVRALRTAESAREARALSPAAAAVAAHQACMAAAAVGERDRARRLSDEAYALALRVPDEGERPGWLYWLDPTRAALQQAEAAYAVRDWALAADRFRAALPGLDGYPRDRAYYEERAADAQARA